VKKSSKNKEETRLRKKGREGKMIKSKGGR
jgi:hypothetical protein